MQRALPPRARLARSCAYICGAVLAVVGIILEFTGHAVVGNVLFTVGFLLTLVVYLKTDRPRRDRH